MWKSVLRHVSRHVLWHFFLYSSNYYLVHLIIYKDIIFSIMYPILTLITVLLSFLLYFWYMSWDIQNFIQSPHFIFKYICNILLILMNLYQFILFVEAESLYSILSQNGKKCLKIYISKYVSRHSWKNTEYEKLSQDINKIRLETLENMSWDINYLETCLETCLETRQTCLKTFIFFAM